MVAKLFPLTLAPSQLPVDEQASGVVEIVSDPTAIDAEIFSVATEIIAGLLADANTITSPEVSYCLCVYNIPTFWSMNNNYISGVG